MQKSEGWKAVWISVIDNYDDLDEYTEDTWDENGERDMSHFAKDFGIDWYDPNLTEFDLGDGENSFAELFFGVSYEEKYVKELLKDLVSYKSFRYRSFLILHDYKYMAEGSSDRAVFIGNYKYR